MSKSRPTEPKSDPIGPSAKTEQSDQKTAADDKPVEVGGRGGLDPVRYGDWEKGGRCIDF